MRNKLITITQHWAVGGDSFCIPRTYSRKGSDYIFFYGFVCRYLNQEYYIEHPQKFFHQVFVEEKRKVCSHVRTEQTARACAMTSPACSRWACSGVPFLRIRPSVLPLELATSWRKVSLSWQPALRNFSESRSCLKDGASIVCVFDAWECPGSGEGRR